MYNHSIRRRYLCNRPRQQLGCAVATYRSVCLLLFVPVQSAHVQISAKYVRGIYAVRVTGRIPEDVELELERRNIKYRPRDQTDQD